MAKIFNLKSKFDPAGDQPKAIKELVAGLKKGKKHQTLLGVTGSGKTFTMANVIEAYNKPTLVIAHNKTLAAQLAQEYRDFFPDHAVHYFVSYYDYYQPEAYIAHSDTYIEKDASINEEIERLRHASTQALLTRRDVIIVASVSCIYGLGSPEEYAKSFVRLLVGDKYTRQEIIEKLISVYYERTNADLTPGTFRAIGNSIEIMLPGDREIVNLKLGNDPSTKLGASSIEQILIIDAISRKIISEPNETYLYPAKHFITTNDERDRAIKSIKFELEERLKELNKEGKLLEAERLKRRTNYDLAMIKEIGYCNGIENYSRHLSGRKKGEAPATLLDYFPKKRRTTRNERGQTQIIEEADFLTIIDESHVAVPQIRGMFAGDESRKKNLVEYGFRLPSALDNRPLRFPEFEERIGQVIYTTATPSEYELEKSGKSGIIEQIIRPTGLIDPEIEVRPIRGLSSQETASNGVNPINKSYAGQIKDFITEAQKEIKNGHRVIATTLTKKMAEDLAEYLKNEGVKSEYVHSEVKTMERIKILTDFRRGVFDCLVGVNLLREGLDLPEVSFIGILDADKEGFLRSEVSLIQTIGRAARNLAGRVILYADVITGSMKKAIDETNRRRTIQIAYNKKHHITPTSITKKIHDITDSLANERNKTVGELLMIDTSGLDKKGYKKLIKEKNKQMSEAVKNLDFETAAILRDEIRALESRV
ncbi:MAG: excinuclease ABC subunit UvrB [Candidatus Vogelbacteria bacterium]|nr:excinuclease ABC subunit UvrB [Candidatus Vogelbacteria bacterium]